MRNKTIEIIKNYFQEFPEDIKDLNILENQTQSENDFFDRKNFMGHVVANALIINNNKVLIMFHNKLKMYIQPGGHIDGTDLSIIEATRREVEEETGLKNIILDNWHKQNGIPILIESHLIPENLKKEEKKHYHHDFMYIFKTNANNIKLQLEEVSEFKWIDIGEVLEKDPKSFITKALERMLELEIM